MQKNSKTQNELYLERVDLVPHIMGYDAFRKANERNGIYWQMMPNPFDGRIPMVKFDTMRQGLKDKINAFYGGNVHDYFAKVPIKNLVVTDAKAELFYRQYRYGAEQVLPVDYQERYTKAASWLNMMVQATEDKAFIKKELGISIDQFWANVVAIIKAEGIDLPTSYFRLVSGNESSIKKYKADGYQSLISGHFGNKRTAKIGKTEEGFSAEREEQQVAVIRKLARLHMNLDATQITSLANKLFEMNSWQTVSTTTVSSVVAKHMPSIISQKQGKKVYQNTVAMQVKRKAPDFPTHYWTLDGWTVELLYQGEVKGQMKYDNRLVMVVVLDACNKYPVGYAIGERENTELIRMALRNAVIHMQQLFGAAYRPWQLQSDNYGIKNLTPFYGALAHLHTPAAVGNAKAKIIEPYFNYLNKTYCQLHYNWSGHNINSKKEHQPNIERLNEIKKTLPTKEALIDQINRFMLRERMSKVEDFKTRWNNMPEADQQTLTPMECIEVFGQVHTHLNSITGHGLIANIAGQEYTFDSFEPAFRALQFTTRFKLIYDACDMSQVVAITEDGKNKFLLHNKMAVGMGYKNTTPQQLDYRQKINQFNKAREEQITQTYLNDDDVVDEILGSTSFNLGNDEEAALKLMFTYGGQQKERLQDAKGLLQRSQQQQQKEEQKEAEKDSKNFDEQRLKYLQKKIDVSQYLD